MQYRNSATEYLDLGPLEARIDTHRRYSEHPEDPDRAVLEAIELAPDGALLDVGSGTGSFLARLRREGHRGRLVGLDSSPAAVRALRSLQDVESVQADAAALPFADGEFAAVSARHMLYHVADPSRAVREARRVLAPGGWFAATTNVADALPETVDLLRTVIGRHGLAPERWSERPLSTATLTQLVEPVFGAAATIEHRNALVYPDGDAFARYCVAMLSFYGIDADSPRRPAIVRDVVAEARRRVAGTGGTLREPKGFSVTVARR